jgi:copper(I)-binding protein
MFEEENPTVSRAPHNSNRRLRIAAVSMVAGLVAVLGLTGCGAGRDTQTDSVQPAVNGTLGQIGPILIRDAQLGIPPDGAFPSGGSAPLVLTIVNTGSTDDELVEVTSPVATGVQISGDRMVLARRALQVGTPDQAVAASSPATVTRTAPSSSSAPSSSTGPARPTTSRAPEDIGKATIVLPGLTEPLRAGKTYPVTFVFRLAGSITLQLPIATPITPRPKPTGQSPG